MTSRTSRRARLTSVVVDILALVLVLPLVVGGCTRAGRDTLHNGEEKPVASVPAPSADEARRQVTALVNEIMAKTLPGRVAKPVENLDHLVLHCGEVTDERTGDAYYQYARSIDRVDKDLAGKVIRQARELWERNGLQVQVDDLHPSVTSLYASPVGEHDQGFGYELTINHEDAIAYFIGDTPCFPRADLTSEP